MKSDKVYFCPHCLIAVLVKNKAKHNKCESHLCNKKNTVVIRAEGKSKGYVLKKMEQSKVQGKCFHLFVNNDKVGNVEVILGKKQIKNE